jgi:hypothetical protein
MRRRGAYVLLEAVRAFTFEGAWRLPGDLLEVPASPARIEEARRLVRSHLAVPVNFASLELLGDCRAPKQRAAEGRPASDFSRAPE